ncbi:MAG: low molecular weight phosphotyrosine protein phosphatase [Rikenellaceae bacterium]|nr:low molecular weight phosphotyrosine protein phosphatase [Rikenellaceae bacterium]
MKKSILFVCLGNICRSPAAEAVMRQKIEAAGLADQISVDSAGTYGGHAGEAPDTRMRRAAGNRGYRLNHAARQITSDDFERFDLIVVMDNANYDDVYDLAPSPEAAEKIHTLAEFFRKSDTDHVPDPYYGGAGGFERVLDLLEDGTQGLLEFIGNS